MKKSRECFVNAGETVILKRENLKNEKINVHSGDILLETGVPNNILELKSTIANVLSSLGCEMTDAYQITDKMINPLLPNKKTMEAFSHVYERRFRELMCLIDEDPSLVFMTDEYGYTFLDCAVKQNEGRVIIDLLKRGANIDQQTYLGRTALQKAIMEGNYRIVKILVEGGADVNLRDYYGESPVGYAMMYSHYPILYYLFKNGANRGVHNKYGKEFAISESLYNQFTKAIDELERYASFEYLPFDSPR